MTDRRFGRLLEAAGDVSRETFHELEAFETELRRWTARINLVAESTLDDPWERHIVDSAQLVRLKPAALRWVDLGAGGGFPGLVLGFLLKERAGGHVDLVESNLKKCAFLQAVAGKWRLPVCVRAMRIERAPGTVGKADVVAARALAALPDLLRLAAPWLQAGATGLFHKGLDYRREVEESALLWRFDLIEHRSITDPRGVILEIGALEKR